MNKSVGAIITITPFFLLTGCVITDTVYTLTDTTTSAAYYKTPVVTNTLVVAPSESRLGQGYYSGFGYGDNLTGSAPYYDGLGAYSSGWYTRY